MHGIPRIDELKTLLARARRHRIPVGKFDISPQV